MNGLNYGHVLQSAGSELVLLTTALIVLLADQAALRDVSMRVRWRITGLFSWAGCVVAGVILWITPRQATSGTDWLGFGMDGLAVWVKSAVLILTFLTVGLSMACTRTKHVGEYLALLLLATVGLMVLAGARDLLLVFVSLELSSLVLYVLAGFEKHRSSSIEAGLKYFLVGSVAAAFTLYGMSLVYGVTGTTHLAQIAPRLDSVSMELAVWVGLALVLAGLAFKVAAAPFHLWAPDTYEGAPTPSAALIASGSKVAAFAVLARVLVTGYPQGAGSVGLGTWAPGWTTMIAVLCVASLLWGTLAALAQDNVRRLLAYSAVGHAGYGLMGFLAQGRNGLSALLYFIATYAVSALGAFGVVAIVEGRTRGSARLADFAGLSRYAPGTALCLLVFLLSMAGIPPLAGFFGKFYLFAAALKGEPGLGLLWLVVLAVAMSTVSLYYYLVVLKQAWVAPPAACQDRWEIPWEVRLTLWITAGAVLLLGAFPSAILCSIEAALQQSGL